MVLSCQKKNKSDAIIVMEMVIKGKRGIKRPKHVYTGFNMIWE